MARRASYSKPRISKSEYSALYVACSPCKQLPNVDDIALVVRDLVRCGASTSESLPLPRLALTLTGKGLKVVRRTASVTTARQQRQPRPLHGLGKVLHSPSDVVLVGQGVDSDVRSAAGVVLHGYDSVTGSWLHLHVYWFDDGGPETAARFVGQISELIDTPEHRDVVAQLENKMISSGQLRQRHHKPPVDFAVQPSMNLNGRTNNMAGKYARHRLSAAAAAVYRQPEVEIRRQSSKKRTPTDDCSWPEHHLRVGGVTCNDFDGGEYIMWNYHQPSNPPRVDEDGGHSDGRRRPASLAVPTPVASLASEFRVRLATGSPILLPPKDYDTVNRSRGNLNGIDERRCANVNIVGGKSRHYPSRPQTYL